MDARKAGKIDKSLGERVRNQRLALDMAQETLADKIGVTFQQVQKYERGLNRISVSRLLQIAKALGTDIGDMCKGL